MRPTPEFVDDPTFRAGVNYALYQLGFAVGTNDLSWCQAPCCKRTVRQVAERMIEVIALDDGISRV